ncbi:MAG: hypothetical protein WBP56_03075 [Polyangia bacterium]
MTNPTLSKLGDLEITLSRAGRTSTLTGSELAQLLDSPGIVIRLAAVLYSRSRPIAEREGTTGIGEATSQEETDERNGKKTDLQQRSFWDEGSRGEGSPACGQSVEQTASYLADKLGDAKSMQFFRRVAQVVPAEVIRDALVTALDLRPCDIRRSRAAYFTSLVMPHLRRCESKP